MKKNIFLALSLVLSLVGCGRSDTLKVGTISGPETELMETAKDVLKSKYDMPLDIVEFSDYSLPNTALQDGAIDANMFQHQPYLDAENKARGYDLITVAKTFIYPMGLYSQKIKSLDALPNKAIVAIPNDPTNEARALLLLQQAGLIKLKNNDLSALTPDAVSSNPKQLQFRELDAAQLPRTLEDVTLAAINTNYAIPAGLIPKRDAIVLESKDSPYANILVVRNKDRDNPKIKKLILALQSDQVKNKAKTLFKDQAIIAW